MTITVDKNIKSPKDAKSLNEIKERINKRFEDIERNFYQIGLDLIKVNMMVKNFRKWVSENTTMGKSTAYTLMQIVKRDKELAGSKKFDAAKRKISYYKLTKLVKYPTDFIDKLDFKKLYEVPGGEKFNLIDMPREMYSEVIDHEYKMMTARERGEEDLQDVPTDKLIISKALSKIGKMLDELQNISTVLAEVQITNESKEGVTKTIEELESIHTQSEHINSVVSKLLNSLKKQTAKRKAA